MARIARISKEKIFNEIITDISENSMSLTDALKVNPKIKRSKKQKIHKDTFYQWLKNDFDLADRYARACEERADLMAEEILSIADSKRVDVNRDKLRVDSRKWLLAKLHPKKYGDKIDMTSGNKPLTPALNITVRSEEAKHALQSISENDSDI
jgi:hypothetical protein